MPLASTIFDEARMLLNEPAAKLYTNTILLPVLRKAYRELQQEMVDNGISVARDQSTALTLPANTTAITFSSSPALPSNLLYPIMLHEKFSGQSDNEYVLMQEKVWTPDETQSERLQYWVWAEDEIKLLGSTGVTLVRLRYWGSLTAIVDGTTNIPIRDCETFLSSRTAAIAAYVIGRMPTIGEVLNADADKALGLFLSTGVKNRQALPTRRKPFRAFRFNRFFWR